MRDRIKALLRSPASPRLFFAPELKPHAVEDHGENEICQSKALNHSSPTTLYQNMLLFISNMDLATFHPLGIAAHNSHIN